MNSKPSKSLKPLLWNATHWSVLASIAYANYAQPTYGARLLDVAAIWAGIINTITVIIHVLLLSHKEFNSTWKHQQQKRKTWQKIHSAMLSAAELIIFAWAGWLWSFGIRLVSFFIRQMVAIPHHESQDNPPQSRH